jgi:uncharacterized protein (DUF1697 family)
MTTYVALLRAVNVGGRTLPMADVRRSLEGLGLRHVRTYRQSGNVVFEADGAAAEEDAVASTARLAAGIEVRIERDLGPRIAVLVLPGEQIAGIVAANPFFFEPDVDEGSLHATFLFTAAGEDEFGEASAAAYSAVYEAAFWALRLPTAEGERAVFVGSPPLAAPVVYLQLPYGYGRSKLTNAFFERKLGTGATTRNWRTVTALAALSAPGAGAPFENDDEGTS